MIAPARDGLPARAPSRRTSTATTRFVDQSKISRSGWGLVVCALLISLSAFPELRIEVSGLQAHLINFGAGLVLLLNLDRLRAIPSQILTSLVTCLLVFLLVALIEPRGLSVCFKLTASLVTVLAAAVAVRTRADFRAAVLAFVASSAIISLRGLVTGNLEAPDGINPLEGIANKNGFSLYVLPPMLVGGYLVVTDRSGRLYRLFVIACILVTTVAIFSTGNRSGWLGMVVILAMIGLKALGRLRNILLVSAIVVAALSLVENFGNTRVIEVRAEKTRGGYSSDSYRVWIIQRSFEVGLEHPLLGVSPQGIPEQIARRSQDGFAPATHNVFATIFAGGGLLLSLAFLFTGCALWLRPRWSTAARSSDARYVHYLLRMMLVLWCLRGLFSDEVLYSQSFSLGIGLCLGLCIIERVWRSNS